MRDPREVQNELDAAQADLERHVGDLKEIVQAKLETPRKIARVARDAMSSLRRNKWIVLLAFTASCVVPTLLARLAAPRRGGTTRRFARRHAH
jgi:hypothetical protein